MKTICNERGKLPLLIIVVVLLVVIGGGAAFTLTRGSKHPGEKKESKKHVELTAWKLDEFVVNLRDREEARYLKINIVLEVEGKIEGGGHGKGGGAGEAKARDAIISVLTSKSYAELQSADGIPALKEELKSTLNETLHDIKVANIYFTSFAMQ